MPKTKWAQAKSFNSQSKLEERVFVIIYTWRKTMMAKTT